MKAASGGTRKPVCFASWSFRCCVVCNSRLACPSGMVLTRLRAGPGRSVAKRVCGVVLDHFDAQYFRELGAAWAAARDVLTSPSCWQYAVLLNRFNYPFDLEEDLHLKGYRTILQRSLPHCPESLKCYLSSTPGRMPSERHQVGNLKKYYLLNAASLLPVLALEPKDGEKVLDLCAAPGGKSIALLQCAYPGYLHCNECDGLRLRWLRQTLESFIPQPLVNVIKVSELDGREVGDAQPETFDKVLVDAPCSNDRSWLFSSESQKAACRISQRRNLPVLQIELLRSAIKALRPGGFLVYSTCTLSKAENQDVISEVLNTHSNVVPVDIEDMARTCSQDFTFAPTGQECGLLVIPDKGKAWGPIC
ncbi:tRNA (cytosine(34)-C(5))-methyltransferase, mitochondrial isoform X2 [Diceros bicornis minor]|uniref:tRNA (cytosine(34)-C(5))-methyltransferase, mitochondrial isoform X2 n=1 Tax=Diceros bicornis minor TaxID=77932 RepID=UPI0026EB420D|nr:tRNA (cytosine(34)-C(5))-methyltransferase, mitochondrial isoform X2 [Diceros bicornis minor]